MSHLDPSDEETVRARRPRPNTSSSIPDASDVDPSTDAESAAVVRDSVDDETVIAARRRAPVIDDATVVSRRRAAGAGAGADAAARQSADDLDDATRIAPRRGAGAPAPTPPGAGSAGGAGAAGSEPRAPGGTETVPDDTPPDDGQTRLVSVRRTPAPQPPMGEDAARRTARMPDAESLKRPTAPRPVAPTIIPRSGAASPTSRATDTDQLGGAPRARRARDRRGIVIVVIVALVGAVAAVATLAALLIPTAP